MPKGHRRDVKTHALHIHRLGCVEAGESPLVFHICTSPVVGGFLVWITRTQISCLPTKSTPCRTNLSSHTFMVVYERLRKFSEFSPISLIIYTVPCLRDIRRMVLYSASRNGFGKGYTLKVVVIVACVVPGWGFSLLMFNHIICHR